MLAKLRILTFRRSSKKGKSDGGETPMAEEHAEAAAHGGPLQQQPPQQHLSPQQLQHLPPHVRAQIEVAHHHDKAGLAPGFRTAGDVKQVLTLAVTKPLHALIAVVHSFFDKLALMSAGLRGRCGASKRPNSRCILGTLCGK